MFLVLPPLALAAAMSLPSANGGSPCPAPVGHLCASADVPVEEPYIPHECDLIFFYKPSILWKVLYCLACTGPPDHVGIVVRLSDGCLVLLEAGPNEEYQVYLMDLPSRLESYPGTIWVRRNQVPLSPCQSAQLTAFAAAQVGKPLAAFRIALAVTPFRARGPIRSKVLGRAHGNRACWFCSELVCEAAIQIGLMDPKVVRPNVTYPHDLFVDEDVILQPTWLPPQRWSR